MVDHGAGDCRVTGKSGQSRMEKEIDCKRKAHITTGKGVTIDLVAAVWSSPCGRPACRGSSNGHGCSGATYHRRP